MACDHHCINGTRMAIEQHRLKFTRVGISSIVCDALNDTTIFASSAIKFRQAKMDRSRYCNEVPFEPGILHPAKCLHILQGSHWAHERDQHLRSSSEKYLALYCAGFANLVALLQIECKYWKETTRELPGGTKCSSQGPRHKTMRSRKSR